MAITLGGGGGASFPTIFLHKSQTWVPPQDGNIMIHVIGAGGSGAVGAATEALAGAAGGYCRKNSLAVTTSGSFTIVIGAGGATRVGSGGGTVGGNSTVAGTGLGSTLTANGGGGGVNSNSTIAGGTASNGDVNNTGGASARYDGGGAVGITGTGNIGGSHTGAYGVFGGDCDVLGDFWASTLGQLSGGLGGVGITGENANDLADSARLNGGPLAGGGSITQTNSNAFNTYQGGNGGIGGGGGGSTNPTNYSYCRSGRGGEGCVVIQYIP